MMMQSFSKGSKRAIDAGLFFVKGVIQSRFGFTLFVSFWGRGANTARGGGAIPIIGTISFLSRLGSSATSIFGPLFLF